MIIKILALLVLLLVSIPGAVAFFEISETQTIIGNGTFEKDFGVQSSPAFSGQKLSEAIVPTYLPHGNYTASYHSNFELIMSNNSSIYYESDSDLHNVKHYLSNENFELGVCTGFYYIGTQNKTFLFESSPSLSEALVKSEADGRSVIQVRVVNRTDYHHPTVDMRTWLDGNYILEWEFLVLDIEFPEAGQDDWLICPHGEILP